MIKFFFIVLCLTIASVVYSQNEVQTVDEKKTVYFVILTEIEIANEIKEWKDIALNYLSAKYENVVFRATIFILNREQPQEIISEICEVSPNGISLIIDSTVTSFPLSSSIGLFIPFIYISNPFSNLMDSVFYYINFKFGKDLAVIFQSEKDADAGLFNLIDQVDLRVIVLDQLMERSIQRMKSLRPQPSFYCIAASTENMNRLFDIALNSSLVTRMDRWILLFLDYNTHNFKHKDAFPAITQIKLDPNLCCGWLNKENGCSCPEDFNIHMTYFTEILKTVTKVLEKNNFPIVSGDCRSEIQQNSTIMSQVVDEVKINKFLYYYDRGNKVEMRVNMSINVNQNNTPDKNVYVAEYTNNNLKIIPGRHIPFAKRFFKVGMVESTPWTHLKRDPVTNELVMDSDNKPIWEGYCFDMLQRLSEVMSFDYEIISPKSGYFGEKLKSGIWDGLIGDLITGDTDIVVAPLKMTAEREEVMDFIAPYFEQTGISIVMRKPVRETSLFKFMTVLRLEVWLSIVGALVATAIMIWLLDKFSPYSARNNREAYPYPCRDFTLKESFWFALTSFTPQGGGEAPKSISGRTLVAAYWLFVVLMLATFTANLAAFLTVERMQTPVSHLEQLARQSRINYTVVQSSDTHQYFINMKHAEDSLYRMWKEITLNSTSDRSEYRVWDYPIKEQYSHILMAIEAAMPVKNASEGFGKVNELINADFAFIHDSAEIKYEISRNCNFTEVGEVFAEQPYALGVQQGSFLQDELSRAILVLQKDRYFEALTAKYWNHSSKGVCDNADDSEGITLESLGGVFIATLFGLALAMITLIGEVFYYRKKEEAQNILKVAPAMYDEKNNTKKNTLSNETMNYLNDKKLPKEITIGSKFVSAAEKTQKVSFISIFPRNSIHQNHNLRID